MINLNDTVTVQNFATFTKMKGNRPSHWLSNEPFLDNGTLAFTCCHIKMMTGHQFRLKDVTSVHLFVEN